MTAIRLVAFDADDTLWRSQDYFDAAQVEFERIVGKYVEIDNDTGMAERLRTVEAGNLSLFGYGVKGMALSMIEAAIELTGERISVADLHRIVGLAKELLQHPVELLPGIRDAVASIAAEFEIAMITKGDLFHQEAKVKASGMGDLFRRIEIVSEKDEATYRRLIDQFGVAAPEMIMVGNALRSDILPVLNLGGCAVHMPYHTTWAHEAQGEVAPDHPRLRRVGLPAELPRAVRELADLSGRQTRLSFTS